MASILPVRQIPRTISEPDEQISSPHIGGPESGTSRRVARLESALLLVSLTVGLGFATNPDLPTVSAGDLIWQLSVISAPFAAWLMKRNELLSLLRSVGPLLTIPALYALSAFWSLDPTATLFATLRLVLAILWAGSIMVLAGGRLWTVVCEATIVCAFLSLALCVFSQFAFDVGGHGFRGAMSQKNSFGSLSAFTILVALLAPRVRPSIRAAGLVVGTVAAVLASSVTAFVGVALALVVGIWIRIRRTGTYWGLAYLASAGFCMLLAYATGITSSLLGEFGKNLTLTGRTGIWADVEKYASERPILGYGYNAFWSWRQRSVALDSINPGLDSAHNFWLESLLAGGAVGLIVVFGVMVLAVRRSLFDSRANQSLALSLLILIFTQTFAESSVFSPRVYGVVALVAIFAQKTRQPVEVP